MVDEVLKDLYVVRIAEGFALAVMIHCAGWIWRFVVMFGYRALGR